MNFLSGRHSATCRRQRGPRCGKQLSTKLTITSVITSVKSTRAKMCAWHKAGFKEQLLNEWMHEWMKNSTEEWWPLYRKVWGRRRGNISASFLSPFCYQEIIILVEDSNIKNQNMKAPFHFIPLPLLKLIIANIFFFFYCVACSLTRDQTHPPCIGSAES